MDALEMSARMDERTRMNEEIAVKRYQIARLEKKLAGARYARDKARRELRALHNILDVAMLKRSTEMLQRIADQHQTIMKLIDEASARAESKL